MMGGSGLLSEAVMEHTNTKLEAAIEDLRIKYEKIRAEEAKQKAEKEAAEKAKAEAEEKKEEENDWTIHEDADLEGIRQARIAALKGTAASRKGHREAGHGDLREIPEEDFLKEVTSTSFVVVHFFHPEFETCRVMDKHLRDLAGRALQTRFLRLNATKAAFFVAKLKVKTLPTLVYFKEGVAIGRQIGYEGLRITTGGATISDATAAASTDFSTPSLARAMRAAGVLGTAPLIGGLDDDAEDEADEEEEGAAGGPGHAALRRVIAEKGAGNAAEALAEARRRMLEEIEAADDL